MQLISETLICVHARLIDVEAKDVYKNASCGTPLGLEHN